nr:uncharacterized protein LOC117275355 [Nicotiana tomentosiformis]
MGMKHAILINWRLKAFRKEMARTRNSGTDTQDAAQETIATIMAQGRTKKASTQKRMGKSTKGFKYPELNMKKGWSMMSKYLGIHFHPNSSSDSDNYISRDGSDI